MSTNLTEHLKLNSWAPTDRFTREEFNQNWDAIDSAAAAETASRTAADTALQKNIDAEASARKTSDDTLQKNITSEASTRKTNDDALQTKINAKADVTALNTEISDRKAADTALQKNIDAKASTTALNTEINDRKTAVSNEATTRANADSALETKINAKGTVTAGSYVGNASPTGSQTINLGFQPKAVYVRVQNIRTDVQRCIHGLAVRGQNAYYNDYLMMTITSTGFTVYTNESNALNNDKTTYYYVAFA